MDRNYNKSADYEATRKRIHEELDTAVDQYKAREAERIRAREHSGLAEDVAAQRPMLHPIIERIEHITHRLGSAATDLQLHNERLFGPVNDTQGRDPMPSVEANSMMQHLHNALNNLQAAEEYAEAQMRAAQGLA